jgi:hypothetical protein
MKTAVPTLKHNRKNGFLEVDVAVALVIIVLAILPLGFAFMQEQKMIRVDYLRAVANEIVDGEMEILAAGDWKNFSDGSQVYQVHSHAAAGLPAGHFELTKTGKHLRLEWSPKSHTGIGIVFREVNVQ